MISIRNLNALDTAFRIGFSNPNLFSNAPIATIIAVTTPAIKKIGFVNSVEPNDMNPFPKLPTTPPSPFSCVAICSPLIPLAATANDLADSLAPSKSNDINCDDIKPSALFVCSNGEPAAKMATFSLASFSLSESKPALEASSAICVGSVAFANSPFKAFNSERI